MVDRNGIGTGLKLWLILLLTFFFLGYPAVLAILWALIGSFAGGVIAANLNLKTPPPMAKPIDKTGEGSSERGRFTLRRRVEERNQVGNSIFGRWGRRIDRSSKPRR
ncbi:MULTISPECIES: hypothetical protein [unclassified Leptolyngbya]|uniref:hypothetical protein n=1 Tax=unclassified Leptolyngbya TaxID=2650499 RepID=UPI001686C406|nr:MULTISPECIES: hypothetical protein [unclassified Leptolyngbya]MBD1913030.1 hypothetical protein [Leptolyngbya sp. FACHB-8]MBD2154469.1 hypothetical protein [Leptolyngbya sp. FACHB-16]